MVEALTDLEFKKKVFDYDAHEDWSYAGTLPCIIDFYADWCQPCRMVAPILQQVAEKFSGHLLVYKVDVDHYGALASLFGITSIPSLLFVSTQDLPRLEVGALSLPDILQVMEEDFGLKLEV